MSHPDLDTALMLAMETLRSVYFDRISQRDLSPPHAVVLRRVAESPTTMRDAAEMLRCHPSYVTAITDVLEERGFLERQSDPNDRRVKNLVITAAGQAEVALLNRSVTGDVPGLTQLTDRQRDELARLLWKAFAPEA